MRTSEMRHTRASNAAASSSQTSGGSITSSMRAASYSQAPSGSPTWRAASAAVRAFSCRFSKPSRRRCGLRVSGAGSLHSGMPGSRFTSTAAAAAMPTGLRQDVLDLEKRLGPLSEVGR